MSALLRSLHVLALGLWFGSMVCFTILGLVLFPTFQQLTRQPADERPFWLPVPASLDRAPPGPGFPDPLRLEQGSRIAGEVTSPLFPWYYGLQFGAGVIALATACGWCLARSRTPAYRTGLERFRLAVLFLALVTVGVGWWLERTVAELRGPRNQLSDQVLLSPAPSAELIQQAHEARGRFGMWHGLSLLDNSVTLVLVALATALAGHLPRPDHPIGHRQPQPTESVAAV
jgi:hypothetical protein